MVDFSQHRPIQRGVALQPSRSMPLSDVNPRRTDTSQTTIHGTPARTCRHRRGLSGGSNHESSPNPYAQRDASGRTATVSHRRNPEYSSPEDCIIPIPKPPTFGIVKALARAISIVLMVAGICAICNTLIVRGGQHAIQDPEAIPSLLMNDEVVRQLAKDNQRKEREIETLKKQIAQAQAEKSPDLPHLLTAIGKYEVGGTVHEHHPSFLAGGLRKARPLLLGDMNNLLLSGHHHPPIGPIVPGVLRAAERLAWDDQGRVQELPFYGGESAAVFDLHKAQQMELAENSPQEHNVHQQRQLHPTPAQEPPPSTDDEYNRDNFQEEDQLHQQWQMQHQQERPPDQNFDQEPLAHQEQGNEYHHEEEHHYHIEENVNANSNEEPIVPVKERNVALLE